GTGDADVEDGPVPAREARTREHRDAHDDRGHPADEADDRVREAEYGTLPGVEVLAAVDERAEVATEDGIRVLQHVELLHRERERRDLAEDARDDEPDAEDPRAGCGACRCVRGFVELVAGFELGGGVVGDLGHGLDLATPRMRKCRKRYLMR